MRKLDLTGRRFGRLVAIEPTGERVNAKVVWRCKCDCGRETDVLTELLVHGKTRSCGCLQDETRRRDITGETRGHLTAICPTGEKLKGETVWMWRCDCGKTVSRTTGSVGTWGATMCPDCAYRLKQEQAVAMLAHVERDEQGRSVEQIKAIQNGALTASNTSGVRGVNWHKGKGKWVARISDGKGKMRTIGYFRNLEDAKAAREYAVRQKYGEKEE